MVTGDLKYQAGGNPILSGIDQGLTGIVLVDGVSVVRVEVADDNVRGIRLEFGVVVQDDVGIVGIGARKVVLRAAAVIEFLDDNLLGDHFLELEFHGLLCSGGRDDDSVG